MNTNGFQERAGAKNVDKALRWKGKNKKAENNSPLTSFYQDIIRFRASWWLAASFRTGNLIIVDSMYYLTPTSNFEKQNKIL